MATSKQCPFFLEELVAAAHLCENGNCLHCKFSVADHPRNIHTGNCLYMCVFLVGTYVSVWNIYLSIVW